jgi:hypothetical protein
MRSKKTIILDALAAKKLNSTLKLTLMERTLFYTLKLVPHGRTLVHGLQTQSELPVLLEILQEITLLKLQIP